MKTEKLTYQIDGKSFTSELFYDDGKAGKRPGVLVCPEANGLSEHTRERARMLVELGYTALAFDLHGGPINSTEEMMGALGKLMEDVSIIRRRAGAALDLLKAHSSVDAKRLGAIGFCYGGTTGLELARSGADVAGVVGFHSGLGTNRPQDAKDIKGKVLVLLGELDPLIPAEQRAAFIKEMTEGGVDYQMVLYGKTEHSFTNKDAASFGIPGLAYQADADRRSWIAMRDFFDEVFA